MSIPTRKAGPAGVLKQMGSTPDERRGYGTREIPPPEHVRRHNELVKNMRPNSQVPDKVRK